MAENVKERRRARRGSWRPYPTEQDPGEHTVAGTVRLLERIRSPQLGNERPVWVYLPPSYAGSRRRYPVVYMHDGQNLFDQATAFGDEWGVDETLEGAAGHGLECIAVAVPNMGGGRLDEYSPWPDPGHEAGGRADEYLAFLVDTLKPVVDRDFRTLGSREHTGVLGSSMGGLVSLYAFFRRPDVFGFAGVMSPALWFAERKVFPFVEEAPFNPGRLYLDIGTNEGKEALGDARSMRDLLGRRGYHRGANFMYRVELGGAHNERAWRRRLGKALPFLLGKEPPVLRHLQKAPPHEHSHGG